MSESKTWEDIDLLVDTDPIALRDFAWSVQQTNTSLDAVLRATAEALEWIAPPHGLTEKRCPKDERIVEAEQIADVALQRIRKALEA